MTLKILFAGHNIFINGLEQGGNGVLIKFADDTKFGDVANIRQDRDLMQTDMGSFELPTGNGPGELLDRCHQGPEDTG